jgi:hypothetical protein
MDGGDFIGGMEAFLRARLGLGFQTSDLFAVPIQLPNDRSHVEKILTILKPEILAIAEHERADMVLYCEQAGLTTRNLTGLVDVGYSGTIQTCLQKILGYPLTGFYMATSERVNAVRKGFGLAFGCFQDAAYGEVMPKGLNYKTVLLEALLTAPHGQLARFEKDDSGAAVPVYLVGGNSQAKFSELSIVFEGGVAYCRDLLATAGSDVLTAILPARRKAFCALDSVLDGRIRVTSRISEALYLEDHFCGNGEIRGLRRLA